MSTVAPNVQCIEPDHTVRVYEESVYNIIVISQWVCVAPEQPNFVAQPSGLESYQCVGQEFSQNVLQ